MALDHLLGRPSTAWKRIEVVLIVLLSVSWLRRNRNRTPPRLQLLDERLRNFAPWQIVALTLIARYALTRASLLVGLNAPEIYAKHYNRNFYRATWILTALDAGFFTAMHIRPAFLRHTLSVLFTVWYLFNARDADEKVRKLRVESTVTMMRCSWDKSTTPILWALQSVFRPWLPTVREVLVDRQEPTNVDGNRFPAWINTTRVKLYYAGTDADLRQCNKIMLHFPGGGFVTMSPENHEEYVRRWAKHLGKSVCIVSVDYRKAPEFPYPYALEECYELYKTICVTNGHCVGVNLASGVTEDTSPTFKRIRITLAGDSAGGNLVAAVTLRIIAHNRRFMQAHPNLFNQFGDLLDQRDKHYLIPKPEGLLIAYGALNFDFACWIAPAHAPILRHGSSTSLSGLMKKYRKDLGGNERSSFVNVMSAQPAVLNAMLDRRADSPVDDVDDDNAVTLIPSNVPGINISHLSLTSRVSFFSDRVITPELTRAMALLYVGQNSKANPITDMYLSPIAAPDEYLAEFPKIWMMCGECDPLVDDTVIFAARVRSAVEKRAREQTRMRHEYLREMKMKPPAPPPRPDQRLSATSASTESLSAASKYDEPPQTPTASLADTDPDYPIVSTVRKDSIVRQLLGNITAKAVDLISRRGSILAKDSGTLRRDGSATSSTTASNAVLFDSLHDAYEEAYGEINQDPASYVTVKIYAGMSHAYLQMLSMLPEAHHAVMLTSHWLEEMFDEGEAARRRRRARRAALAAFLNTDLESQWRNQGVEMRDEDNIPESVQLPTGAEYRLGGTSIQLRKPREVRARSKYFIGDTESSSAENTESEEESVETSVDYRRQNPLQHAMSDKQRDIVRTLHESSRAKHFSPHTIITESDQVSDTAAAVYDHVSPTGEPVREVLVPSDIRPASGALPLATSDKAGFQPTRHTVSPVVTRVVQSSKDDAASGTAIVSTDTSVIGTGNSPTNSQAPAAKYALPAHMFLSEHDLVAKRRASIVRDAYSGVDPVVLRAASGRSPDKAKADKEPAVISATTASDVDTASSPEATMQQPTAD